MDIVNISTYKFVELPDIAIWRAPIRERCLQLGLKGTILLAPEGINVFLAGTRPIIEEFLDWLRSDARFGGRFADLVGKESISSKQPFNRMLVKLKKEIITMRHPTIRPMEERAPAIKPATLQRWLDQGHDDDGREVVLMDTRNAFEVDVGTFEGAIQFDLHSFGEFPQAIRQYAQSGSASDAPEDIRKKTIVTFCTGGIRCEKAVLFMRDLDLPHVVQLDGGILKYFEDVGGAHWRGECFVFDDRVALDPGLLPTATRQCYACRAVVTVDQQKDPRYQPPNACPHCADRHLAAA